MKPSITNYADAEVMLGVQGRLSDTEGYCWVCLEGYEDVGPFDTRKLADQYLADRRAENREEE